MIELNEEEFRVFLDNHPQKFFLQTPEIGELRKKNNWEVYYLGLKDGEKLVAATMLLGQKIYLNKKQFYCPKGPMLDYNNKELLNNFINNLKEFVKKHNGVVLRIDPYIIKVERDIDGNVVPNGIDNQTALNNLKQMGFKEVSKPEQVKWMFVLNIENKTSDKILNEMHSNTRSRIKSSIKTGVEIRELSFSELSLFKKITDETSERKKFANRDLKYYENMYNLFNSKQQIKYLVSQINLDSYIESLEKDKAKILEQKKSMSPKGYNEGKIKELESSIISLDKKINEAGEILKEKGSNLYLSAAMFMLYGDEIIYLASGNIKEYMVFGGQYRIQWEMINYGIEHHFKRYNFYGITGIFDPEHKDYGIYQFKRGFNGCVEELIGELEFSRNSYCLYKIILKIKNMVGKRI